MSSDQLNWLDKTFTSDGGTAVVEVADDIAQSGGDGTAVDRVQGINGVAIATADTLGVGEVWLKRGGGATLRAGRPCPPGWFDPLDYGCPWDGIHDDLPGLEAMLTACYALGIGPKVIHLPPGRGYCSDNLHIQGAITIRGHGGAFYDVTGASVNGIRFAPGKSLILDSYWTCPGYPDRQGADGSRCEDFSIDSTQLVVSDPVGGLGRALKCLDTSVDIRGSSTYYAKGRVVLAAGGAGSGAQIDYLNEGGARGGVLVMFRVTVAGTTAGGAAPAGFTKTIADLGDTFTDGGVTWQVESVPKDYENATHYDIGQRVFLPGDAQCYFECTVAGTSMSAGALNGAANGIGVTCPNGMLAPTYHNLIPDGPDTLVWKAYFPSGVMILANACTVDRMGISGFTGYAINALCNLDATTYPDSGGNGGTNFTNIYHPTIGMCGGGVRFHGADANGGMTTNVNTVYLGTGRTDVDAALSLPANTFGQGTAGIWDRGQGGQGHYKAYVQFSSGPPFRNDLFGGGGNASVWDKCTAETSEKCLFEGFPVVVGCEPIAPTGGGIVLGANGRNVQEIDRTHADTWHVRLSNGTGGLYAFRATDDLTNEWGWKYSAGFWTFGYNGSIPSDCFYVTGFGAGFSPGSGWLGTERGMFFGDKATALFRGNWDNATSSTAIRDRGLRSGLRRTGDTFEGAATKVTLTGDGYRGEIWTNAGQTVTAGDIAYGYAPYIVEPSANTTAPQANRSVWKCTVGGTMDVTEPTWSSATPDGGTSVGDVLTEGGGVEWTLVGFTPHYDVEQRVAKATIPTRLVQVQTTTGAASQVLFSGGVVSKIDLALPEDSMVIVTDTITVHKPGTADGGDIVIRSTWVRNGTAAPVEIGTGSANPTYNLSGATLAASTVVHVANGNRIELQGDPQSADTLEWRIFRTQATGEDS